MPFKSLAMHLCRWADAASPNAEVAGCFFPRQRIDKHDPAPHKGRDNSWEKTRRFRLSPVFSRNRSHGFKSAPSVPCWIAALTGSAGIGTSPVITPRWLRCSLRLQRLRRKARKQNESCFEASVASRRHEGDLPLAVSLAESGGPTRTASPADPWRAANRATCYRNISIAGMHRVGFRIRNADARGRGRGTQAISRSTDSS
jgi:hypothetical protein